jgi:hypothetical protein
LKQAAGIAGKSESTLRGWYAQHGFGRRVDGGAWLVSKVALAMFLDGEEKALRAYHAGDHAGGLVVLIFAGQVSAPSSVEKFGFHEWCMFNTPR